MFKKLIVILFAVPVFCSSQNKTAHIEFEKVIQTSTPIILTKDSIRYFTFVFKNTGDYTLVINRVRTVCGCTAVQWPKEPIPPKQSNTIKIKFKPGKFRGQFLRSIFVHSNADNSNVKLTITGKVLD